MEESPSIYAKPSIWRNRCFRPSFVLAVVCVLFVVTLSTGLSNDESSKASVSRTGLRSSRHLENSMQKEPIRSGGRFLEDGEPDDGCDEDNPFTSVPFGLQIFMIAVLILFSALFSGLTLGLMGLDKTGLEIVMEGEDADLADAAKKIYPVRKNGNLLLCTLLLGNVAVNALLSILLADKAGGAVGFVVSTGLILLFGEILPQAICSRYALQIGRRTVPLVRVIMILFYPIAGPLAYGLNKALGHELATTYSTAEMRKLLEIHVKEGRFDQETGTAMTGALKYKDILVKEVMTPLKHTFMLNVDEKLNFETIATIFKTGYSRIPVYEFSQNNIIGLLFVKDLIFIDPEDETPVRNFVQIFGRGVHVVWPDDKLGDVLRELKQGRSHMALVRDVNNENEEQDPFYEIKGIITLEDIIEEIIGDEIVDETDAFVDVTHSIRVNRMEAFDWGRLRLLDSKIVDETLSHDEAKAVTAHLRTNHSDAVSLLSDTQLQRLVSKTNVTELGAALPEVGKSIPDELIYQKGVPSDVCTLILGGKVTVLAGADEFRSDVSSWSLLAGSALTEPSYAPDFTAFVSSGPCRCLRFTREMFTAAVDASALEKRMAISRKGSEESVAASTVSATELKPSVGSGVAGKEVKGTGDETSTVDNEDAESHHSKKREIHHSRRSKLIAAIQQSSASAPSPQTNTNSIDYMESDAALLEKSDREEK